MNMPSLRPLNSQISSVAISQKLHARCDGKLLIYWEFYYSSNEVWNNLGKIAEIGEV